MRSAASPRSDDADRADRARKKRKDGPRRSLIGRIAYWSLVLGLWCFIGAIGVIGWVAAHLPPIQSLEVPKRPPSIQIVGLNGRVLATRGEMGGSAVPLRELPPFLPKAFLAIEDRRFYSHYGVDPFGVARAVGANVLHRGVVAGRLDHHAAARQEPVPDAGAHHAAQAAGGDPRVLARAQIFQGRDPRSLSQPRLFRLRRLRRRSRRAALLRQVGAQRDALGSRAAGGPGQVALEARADAQLRRRRAARADRARRDVGCGLRHGAKRPRPRSRLAPKIVKQTRRRLDQLRRRLGDGRARRRGRARRAGHRGRDHDRSDPAGAGREVAAR